MPEIKKLFETKKIENFWSDDFVLSSADLIAAKEGIKRVARTEYKNETDLARIKNSLSRHKLEFASSDKKLFETYCLYVSRDKKLAQKAKEIDPSFLIIHQHKTFNETTDSIRSFGWLLNYPDCCVNEYIENVLSQTNITECRAFKKLPSKISFLFNNQLNGLSNHSLSFHFPCSFDCQKSLKYLERVFGGVEKNSPVMAASFRDYFKRPFLAFFDQTQSSLYVSWDKRQGFIFDGKINGKELNYSSVIFFKTTYPEFKEEGARRELLAIQKKIEKGNRIIFNKDGFGVYKGKNLLMKRENKGPLRSYFFNFV